MKIKFLLLFLSAGLFCTKAQPNSEKIFISKDIELLRLTQNVYIHTSYYTSEQYGRFPSNGMIYIQGDEAFIFDTPMTEELTIMLINYIQDSLGFRIVGFIPNHWHDDCTGGLKIFNELGVNSYSNEMTKKILVEKNLPVTKNTFKDSLSLDFGNGKIICKYYGGGHSTDNIVVWLSEEKILFAGCMSKEINSKGLGNIADADLENWQGTIKKVMAAFPDAKYVIPGHGKVGGIELLEHTLELLMN